MQEKRRARFAAETDGPVFYCLVTEASEAGFAARSKERAKRTPVAVGKAGLFIQPQHGAETDLKFVPWDEVEQVRVNRYDEWVRVAAGDFHFMAIFEHPHEFAAACEAARR